ncbi:uncharacterized protein [Branchiostoma lanceolatum]|uniref:uncharacterized protein n=1 Tax=Branchiostoma lanceolatum TaxID=7740 RepID=UPI0034550781
MAKPVVLDTDGGELEEIGRRLHDDGLDPTVDDELKLRHVWRLYQRSEVSLKSALADIQDLKLQQAEEMKEVENYVEHIRSLSEEREALTSEFEAENEILRNELEQRKVECDAIAEVREMLQQEGLQQVAESGLSEQVAYLLVERARLMDELETAAEKRPPQLVNSSADVDQLRQLLERERADHEEELKQQRENMMRVKESLTKVHDHELHELSRSKDELEEELGLARSQLFKSQEFKMDQDSLDAAKLTAELETAREDLQEDLDQLQARFHRVEQERDALQKEVSRLQLEQREDRSKLDRQVSSLDESTQNLRQQLDKSKRELSDSQASCRTLEDEKRALEMRLEFAKKDLEAVKERERQAVTQKESLASSGEGAQRRLNIQISEMQSENIFIFKEWFRRNKGNKRQQN